MANLTQAQLDAMQKDRMAGYMNPVTGEWISQSGGGVIDATDPSMQIGNWNAAGVDPSMLASLGFDPNSQYTYGKYKPFDPYSIMDSEGKDTGKIGHYATDRGLGRELAMAALMMAGGAFAGGALGGAGAGATGTGGGMVNGAFLGEGALSGIPAWDGALAAAGAGTAAGGGAVADGLTNGLNGSDLMSDAFTANGGYGGGGFGGTSGGWWDNLINGSGGNGLSGLLGDGPAGTAANGAAKAVKSPLLALGTTALGGLLGSQGRNVEQTTKQDIPEELKPYVYGENGLLSQAMSQLNTSRSPERMGQWNEIRNRGFGLLQKPMAGNPTAGWTFNR